MTRSSSRRPRPPKKVARETTLIPLHSIEFAIHSPINPFGVVIVFFILYISWWLNKPQIATAFILSLATVHLYCRIVLGGWTQHLPVPSDDEIFVPLDAVARNDGDLLSGAPLRIVVTGGGGFLGWTIVDQLKRKDSQTEVVVVDLYPPHPSRIVEGVRYVIANLATDNLAEAFHGAHGVIHTAGIVDLTIDTAMTHNAHVVGTARVIAAARSAGLRFLVMTSSVGCVTSPHIRNRSQSDLASDFIPPEIDRRTGTGFPFFSSYSSTKFRSERMTLAANAPGLRFRTLAVRLPMIYGLQDPMIVLPLFRGERDKVPDGSGALVEFVYVKNAASMHIRCLYALLEEEERGCNTSTPRSVNGRAFNVTNGDIPRQATEIWNDLIHKINKKNENESKSKSQSKIPEMQNIPYGVMYGVACITESIFALCCGHVPARRNPVWNLTRASLSLSCTTVTQDMQDTYNVIDFTPEFSTMQSFDAMVEEEYQMRSAQEQQQEQQQAPAGSETKNVQHSTFSRPLDAISWAPADGVSFNNVDFFGRMSGPGMSNLEVLVTFIGMLLGALYAYSQRRPEWTNLQLSISLMFALVNASAVAQCTTPSSKRWYHMGGRLADYLAYVIVVEVAVLIITLHVTFGNGGVGGLSAISSSTAMEASGLALAVLATHYAPLPIQRAVGVLCLCCGLGMLQLNNENCPGMEWCCPLLLIKYCISHVPRHEPYI